MEKLPVLLKSSIKNIQILCEVAKNPKEIATGLMGRKTLADNEGMIFLFESPHQGSFWMLNTFIPLSIAFFDGNGKILDIQAMEPLTIDGHKPSLPYIGALEMNQGWFETNQIKIGDIINFV